MVFIITAQALTYDLPESHYPPLQCLLTSVPGTELWERQGVGATPQDPTLRSSFPALPALAV